MFFPKCVYMTKNTPLFPILHVFAPLNDVYARTVLGPEKQTLITWIFGRAWYPPWHSSGPRVFFFRGGSNAVVWLSPYSEDFLIVYYQMGELEYIRITALLRGSKTALSQDRDTPIYISFYGYIQILQNTYIWCGSLQQLCLYYNPKWKF